MSFKEEYYRLKEEFRSDKEIARLLLMSYSGVYQLKKKYGIPPMNRPKTNKQGLSEEQLRHGESIGLSRERMYKRVRVWGWTPKDACTLKQNEERRIGVEYGGK